MALPLKSLWAQNFYPRPPRGGRPNAAFPTFWSLKFLSTPSARRATVRHHIECLICGISIHALRKEGDGSGGRVFSIIPVFLSTPSARRATNIGDFLRKFCGISIHALREEGDIVVFAFCIVDANFYPRPPRGGRQQKQRENTLLLSHYTPPCTNCKEVSVKQAVKLHRYLHSRPLFQCKASRKTMCTVCSHWPDIKRSARCPVQTPGATQRVRPWSGSCCPVGRTADCLRRGRSGRSAPP